jgi:hypothetical protein
VKNKRISVVWPHLQKKKVTVNIHLCTYGGLCEMTYVYTHTHKCQDKGSETEDAKC